MVSKAAETVQKQREEERKRALWMSKRKTYWVRQSIDLQEEISADGFLISEPTATGHQYLIFIINCGDEVVEVGRFKEWTSVTLDIDCVFKENNP